MGTDQRKRGYRSEKVGNLGNRSENLSKKIGNLGKRSEKAWVQIRESR